ncbi:MAG: PLDc N-terminal domain-containing protein [Planctomycetota bacterium]|nr:PLDc N-terminal domain-containing protein [Planctomycetota bacterium]
MSFTILSALVFALDLVAIVSLLLGGGSVGHKVFWIFLILILPILGMILYFLIDRSPVDA